MRGSGVWNRGSGGKTVCFLVLLSLAACGFSPVYGTRENGADVARALHFVAIENIPDREGQILRNHLIDRFYMNGRPSSPKARLNISVKVSEVDLGIQKDATASRRELSFWAPYVLEDMKGKELLSGSAHSVVSYSRLEAQYGTVSARRGAYERALREVGEQIANRIALYYAETPPPLPPPSFLLPQGARVP